MLNSLTTIFPQLHKITCMSWFNFMFGLLLLFSFFAFVPEHGYGRYKDEFPAKENQDFDQQ